MEASGDSPVTGLVLRSGAFVSDAVNCNGVPYDAIVLASAKLARDRPAVLDALRALADSIDADAMRRMNLAVDGEGRTARSVASEFLDAR